MRRRKSTGDTYDLRRRGCFGVFESHGATSILYLSTVFGIDEIRKLSTAKEAVSDSEIDFDAMIQREIVPSHVAGIQDYFLQQRLVRFFPPLLVAAAPIDGDRLRRSLLTPSVGTTEEVGILRLEWKPHFQLEIGIPLPDETTRTVRVRLPGESAPRNFVSYLAELGVNTDETRLIVVDGQHRLQALRRLQQTDEGREATAGLTIPVCIFWPITADETAVTIMRSIFVDVNSTAKQVSGHFRILLSDDDLASISVRRICDEARRRGLLKHIEWNQHDARAAERVTFPNKFTGVKVLWDCLRDSGVTSVRSSRDTYIMRRVLPELYGELEPTTENISGVLGDWKPSVPLEVRRYAETRAQEVLAPNIVTMLERFRPFAVFQETVEQTMAEFRSRRGDRAAAYREAAVCLEYMAEPPTDSVVTAVEEISQQLRSRLDEMTGFNFAVYRTKRFQQGLFAGLYWFVDIVVHSEGRPKGIAVLTRATELYLAYLNEHVYEPSDRVFPRGASWLDGLITRGTTNAIIKSNGTRNHVARLLLARLGVAAKKLQAEEAAICKLEQLGRDCAGAYYSSFVEVHQGTFIEQLDNDKSLDEEERAELVELRARAMGIVEVSKGITPEEATAKLKERARAHVIQVTLPARQGLEKAVGYSLPEPHGGLPTDTDDDGRAGDEDRE